MGVETVNSDTRLVWSQPRGPGPERGAIVDEEPPVPGKLRMKRKAEQSPLVVADAEVDDPVGDIEERPEAAAGVDDPDDAGKVGDEEPAGPVAGSTSATGMVNPRRPPQAPLVFGVAVLKLHSDR